MIFSFEAHYLYILVALKRNYLKFKPKKLETYNSDITYTDVLPEFHWSGVDYMGVMMVKYLYIIRSKRCLILPFLILAIA